MSEPIQFTYFNTPCGELKIGSFQDKLCLCDWRYRKQRDNIDARVSKFLDADFEEGASPVIEETQKELDSYFKNREHNFTIPLLLPGTDFQQTVWQKLTTIPVGETMSYLELSHQLGNPKAIRAIASANGANAISIIIPCHRVIGSNGELVGYAGGLPTKKILLKHEGADITRQLNLW